MTDSKEHVEELQNRSEILSLELDELNDDIERREKRLNKLKQTLREIKQPKDESSELDKLLQEKETLQNKVTTLEPLVNEKLEMVEELESKNVLDEEELSSVMNESLQDLDQQAIAIQKKVDEKTRELNALKK